MARLLAASLAFGRSLDVEAGSCLPCKAEKQIPPPNYPQEHNGVTWPTMCLEETEAHFFAIGDWGGMGKGPMAFDNTGRWTAKPKRPFVESIDRTAQRTVADVMKEVAKDSHPKFIINVGDNFYPGGIVSHCADADMCTLLDGRQFAYIFEHVYNAPELEGLQWMGIFGNHDYGGYQYDMGWDQQIAYTWYSDQWIIPAQYWMRTVQFCDFSIDFYFLDTQVFDVKDPHEDHMHNLCNMVHNKKDCSAMKGPKNPWDCVAWFKDLWLSQQKWLEDKLRASDADWQIVVTHFPPEWGLEEWRRLAVTYGIDLFITGHRHQQEMHLARDKGWDPIAFTYSAIWAPWIVTGGGGGVTSERNPYAEGGYRQQYGFFDIKISKSEMQLDMWSWQRHKKRTETIKPMAPVPTNCAKQGCGGEVIPGKPCYCRESCLRYNNCCADYHQVCVAQRATCETIGCDNFVKGAPCQCTFDCTEKNNCCPDFKDVCVLNSQNPQARRLNATVPRRAPVKGEVEATVAWAHPMPAFTDDDPRCSSWAAEGGCTDADFHVVRLVRSVCRASCHKVPPHSAEDADQPPRHALAVHAATIHLHAAMSGKSVAALEKAIERGALAYAAAKERFVQHEKKTGKPLVANDSEDDGEAMLDGLLDLLQPAERTLYALRHPEILKSSPPEGFRLVGDASVDNRTLQIRRLEEEEPVPEQGGADQDCVADYGTELGEDVCCDQKGKVDKESLVCSDPEYPRCHGYILGETTTLGKCKAKEACSATRRRRWTASCTVLGCGVSDVRAPCQCTRDCAKEGNCCTDFDAQCADKLNTCAHIGCGTFNKANPCQCNEHCVKFNSCCKDWNVTCGDAERAGFGLKQEVPLRYDPEMLKADFDEAEPDCLSMCGKSGECDMFCGPAKACCKRGAPDNGPGCPLENQAAKEWVDYTSEGWQCVESQTENATQLAVDAGALSEAEVHLWSTGSLVDEGNSATWMTGGLIAAVAVGGLAVAAGVAISMRRASYDEDSEDERLSSSSPLSRTDLEEYAPVDANEDHC
eukprot:TRINITY_DN5641_c0_g1_i1.p1 TRINITY_DN5641_c0_g1~~TRINITY_DN5641_c0_g1_i1.p1  ORF type:complete len:1035 (+),score=267.73 TRINITY_DN5641_c0_g1_i1:104-3208(+)